MIFYKNTMEIQGKCTETTEIEYQTEEDDGVQVNSNSKFNFSKNYLPILPTLSS